MPYGHWIEPQRKVIGQYVAGRGVLDLGSGDLHWAREVLKLGASRVTAVDKNVTLELDPTRSRVADPDPNLDVFHGYFVDFIKKEPTRRFDVGLLSWPSNHLMIGIMDLIRRCDQVIYVGSNMYGSACGWPSMFAPLSRRDLLAYVPWRGNNLLIYGAELGHPRPIVGEEYAGMFNEDVMTHEVADKRAAGWRGVVPPPPPPST